jgi:hypothetical protein
MNKEIKSILTKRFQTTMIGSLYEFEQVFGYLWGLDKDESNLTPTENKFRLLWEDTRNAILNNGNNQLRKCIADLDRVEKDPPKKYTYKFYKRGHYED